MNHKWDTDFASPNPEHAKIAPATGPDPEKPHNFSHGNRIDWKCDVCQRGPDHNIHKIAEGRRMTRPDTRQPDKHGWRDIASAPSDGQRVFVWGGYTDHEGRKEYFPVAVTSADGGWWRVAGLKSTPTHWQPTVWPAPPEQEP